MHPDYRIFLQWSTNSPPIFAVKPSAPKLTSTRRKIESAILWANGRAVISHCRRLVRHPWLIEIVSYGVDDPLAILVRTERVAADRRLRRDTSIGILDEQIQTKPSVGHRMQRCD